MLRSQLLADPSNRFLHDVILDSCRRHPEKLALIDASNGRRFTYAEYGDAVERLARGFVAAGLKPGEVVGYGMRYSASSERRIAILPIGYGDGFPRVRNQGGALIHGKRAPLIGGIAMDALMVDITDIPEAKMWDEAVIMGRQGNEEISVHDMAKLKNSVSYDVLTNWRLRLRRKSVNGRTKAARELETVAAK